MAANVVAFPGCESQPLKCKGAQRRRAAPDDPELLRDLAYLQEHGGLSLVRELVAVMLEQRKRQRGGA